MHIKLLERCQIIRTLQEVLAVINIIILMLEHRRIITLYSRELDWRSSLGSHNEEPYKSANSGFYPKSSQKTCMSHV